MAENETGTFDSCLDLESSFQTVYGRQIPCFAPLVWTINDENANNRPNLTEIEMGCAEIGCTPYCLRAGEKCIKYTVMDRNKEKTVKWESSFCGQGTNWDGETISRNRCFTENQVEGYDHRVCFCDDTSLCNSAMVTTQKTVGLGSLA